MSAPRYTEALGHGLIDKRIEILRGIARSGSISQAAREAGVSYKAAWQAIDTLTNLAGVALVERAVGGVGGGGALLTVQGGELLALAEAFDVARQAVHARWSEGAVSTASGAGVAMARLAVRTSMRNQFPAVIETMQMQGHVVRVPMRVGEAGACMAARITRESAELLGLAEGMQVIALCKATAVRVERSGAARVVRGNQLEGVATRVVRGERGDEVTMTIAPGIQLVGFAKAESGLRTRQRVQATVDEAAVVVALPG